MISLPQYSCDMALQGSLDVLERTADNGGLREEASLVMNNGQIVQSPTGEEPEIVEGASTAETHVPPLPTGTTDADVEAMIHSHPTEIQIVDGMAFPHSANVPTGADLRAFSRFDTNIIVGPLGTVNGGDITANADGSVNMPSRPNGLVIYNSAGAQTIQLTKKAATRIVRN